MSSKELKTVCPYCLVAEGGTHKARVVRDYEFI